MPAHPRPGQPASSSGKRSVRAHLAPFGHFPARLLHKLVIVASTSCPQLRYSLRSGFCPCRRYSLRSGSCPTNTENAKKQGRLSHISVFKNISGTNMLVITFRQVLLSQKICPLDYTETKPHPLSHKPDRFFQTGTFVPAT